MTIDAGTRLGRYTVLRNIASGGMAEVYLAMQQGPDGFEKPVAIKQIHPHLASDEQFVRMFHDEARVAARLNHPNIVQIFDLGVDGATHYLAMEYVFGESLAQLRDRCETLDRPLPVATSLFVATNLCLALHHAHTFSSGAGPQPIIHRDLSPQNVLVSFDGAVKLADFGVAKVKNSQRTTTVGLIKGKVGYMSPEQILGESVDARTDLFALGIVLYELVTRQPPFRGKSMRAIFDAVTSDAPPQAPSTVCGCAPELDAVLLKALRKRPEERFQSAAEMLDAIEDVQRRLGLVTNPLALGRQVVESFGLAQVRDASANQSPVSRILAYLDARTGRVPRAPEPGSQPAGGDDDAPTLVRGRQ